jgi:hypothetical protein
VLVISASSALAASPFLWPWQQHHARHVHMHHRGPPKEQTMDCPRIREAVVALSATNRERAMATLNQHQLKIVTDCLAESDP